MFKPFTATFAPLAGILLLAATAAAAPEKYQVTGPVTAMDATTITIVKGGKEKFVMARDAGTKMTGGDLKVGDKVTVQYTITATDVEVKADKAAAGGAKVKKEKSAPTSSVPMAPAPAPAPAGVTR